MQAISFLTMDGGYDGYDYTFYGECLTHDVFISAGGRWPASVIFVPSADVEVFMCVTFIYVILKMDCARRV